MLKGEQSGLWTRGCGKRFVVRNDEKLTTFLELKTAIGSKEPT
jgi:hypothetical protein